MTRATVAVAVGLWGCAGGEPEDSEPAPACEGDFEAFEPGMSVGTTQGNFEIEITSASPSPPDEGENDWVLTVTRAGTPMNGGAVVVTPFMPAHDHGLSPPNYSGANLADGQWEIPTFDLIMPGTWEFRFLVTESMMNDTVAVSFCIEG